MDAYDLHEEEVKASPAFKAWYAEYETELRRTGIPLLDGAQVCGLELSEFERATPPKEAAAKITAFFEEAFGPTQRVEGMA